MSMDSIIEEVRKLSRKQRHELVDVIFEMDEDKHISDEESGLAPEQLAELERRYEEHRRNPREVRPWSDLYGRVRSSR